MRTYTGSFWALLAFVASIPLEDALQVRTGSLSKLLGLVALATWFLGVLCSGKVRRPAPTMLVGAIFVGWSLASYFWSEAPSRTLDKAATLLQLLGLLWLLWDQTSTLRDLIAVMRAFLLGALLASALTFVNAVGTDAAVAKRFGPSVNAGPNNTGVLLAIAIMMACYLLLADDNRRWKTFYWAFLPGALVAQILTASRTAALSLAVGLAVIVIDTRKLNLRRTVALAAVGLVVAGLAVVYVPQRSVDRLGTTADEISSGTLNGRLGLWELSLQVASEHPIRGVGSGAFPEVNLERTALAAEAHNLFLSVLAEVGAVGVILFVAMLLMAAIGLIDQPRDQRRTWLAIGLTWFVGASSLTWEMRKITWFVLAIALVQARVGAPAERRVRASDPHARHSGARSAQAADPLATGPYAAASPISRGPR